ncbi:MAG: hypothetical protein EBT97_11485 [Actinobacteria bacterium]|nr:hypothetical protein [Actinomycetota bacterium]
MRQAMATPDLAELFSQHMKNTSVDRREQTQEFRAIIGELRNDIRVLGVLGLLGMLALAGVQVVTPDVKLTPPGTPVSTIDISTPVLHDADLPAIHGTANATE